MQMRSFECVSTVTDALRAAKEHPETALYFAGGTDILVKSRENECYADRDVIDIYGVEELRGVTDCGDRLKIGALTTHTQIAESELVQTYARVLALASSTVGSLQIRNHATIGGNIANASPAADTLAALAVLRAEIEIRRGDETLLMPLYDVITRPYRTSLIAGDLITAIYVNKLPSGCVSDFYKLGRRRALAISRMTIATLLSKDAEGRVTFFDMTLGATFPRPQRFDDISALLTGKIPTEADIEKTAKALSDKIPEIAGIRASTTYKQPVANKLAARILRRLILGEADE